MWMRTYWLSWNVHISNRDCKTCKKKTCKILFNYSLLLFASKNSFAKISEEWRSKKISQALRLGNFFGCGGRTRTYDLRVMSVATNTKFYLWGKNRPPNAAKMTVFEGLFFLISFLTYKSAFLKCYQVLLATLAGIGNLGQQFFIKVVVIFEHCLHRMPRYLGKVKGCYALP